MFRDPTIRALLLGLLLGGCGGGEDALVTPRGAGLIDAQGTVRAAAEAKCEGWGYPKATLPAHHAACVRMAMADYCGDGRSFTMNGTRIDMYDDLGLNQGGGTAPFRLEAIWAAHGSRTRLVCLSHARWDTLPPGGVNCPGQPLIDPRLASTGSVCDYLPWDVWKTLSVGTPLFKVRLGNDSAFLDKGLYRWSSPAGSYTTADQRYDQVPAGYSAPPSFEGAVFWRDEVEAVYPGSAPYLSRLHLCERAAPPDRFTTTQVPPPAAGYSCSPTLARVFSPTLDPLHLPEAMPADLQTLFKGQVRPLRSYRHVLNQRHVTLMDGNPRPPGYLADERLEGYVLHRVP